jgi:hypothetical protein
MRNASICRYPLRSKNSLIMWSVAQNIEKKIDLEAFSELSSDVPLGILRYYTLMHRRVLLKKSSRMGCCTRKIRQFVRLAP